MALNKFVLTGTFCYVSPHVQINGMGFDAVYAQTKENHYVDPMMYKLNNNWLPVSTSDSCTPKAVENELGEMLLYSQGNMRRPPEPDLIVRQVRQYGSPGDGELDMRKFRENKQGEDD